MSTYVRALTKPSSVATVGEAWTFSVDTVNENGYTTGDVLPVFTVTRPDMSTVVPVAFVPTFGMYAFSYTLDVAGRFLAHVSTPDDALDMAVYAIGPTTTSGMPNANDAANYLGESAGSWSTLDIADALAAERAAQRAMCGERAQYPDDLRQALLRRVSRNLAMRRLPLAVNMGDADSGPLVLPGRDPEVRRFEAPYRKLVLG